MKPTDTLKVYGAELPLYDKDGNEVVVGVTITNPIDIVGVVTSPFEFTSASDLDVGDNIEVQSETGVYYPNTVISVGDTYRVSKKLESRVSDSVGIKLDYQVLTITALPEGLYTFSNNEILLIADRFINIRISFAELNARFDELSKTVDLEVKNNEAIKSVLADFSYLSNLFSYLDMNTIRELIILKMIMWLSAGTDRYEEDKNNYMYYKKNVELSISVNSTDGSMDNSEQTDHSDGFGWNVRA